MTNPAPVQPLQDDPVLSLQHLPLQARLYPLGFAFDLHTNSRRVVQAARSSWGRFPSSFGEKPVRMEISVTAERGASPLPPPVFRSRNHLFTVLSDSQNCMTVDLAAGYGHGWFTEAALRDEASFRYFYLDAAVLSMIDQLHLAPVHGALVVRNGSGVLLCADSFAGKSTLSYACARSGWTFVSDDGTFLVRKRQDRFAIGNPHAFRLRPDSRRFFPELNDRLAHERPNGKIAVEVATAELPGIATAPSATVDHVVFLNRPVAGAASLTAIGETEVLPRFAASLTYGSAEAREERLASYSHLMSGGLWRLNYHDLDSAVARLERLVDTGA